MGVPKSMQSNYETASIKGKHQRTQTKLEAFTAVVTPPGPPPTAPFYFPQDSFSQTFYQVACGGLKLKLKLMP